MNRQPSQAPSVLKGDTVTIKDESVIGDNQINELEKTIADVFKMINTESNALGGEFKEKMDGFNKVTDNLITSVKTKKAKAKAKRYSKTPQVHLKKEEKPTPLMKSCGRKRRRRTEAEELESNVKDYLNGYTSGMEGVQTRSRKRRRLY